MIPRTQPVVYNYASPNEESAAAIDRANQLARLIGPWLQAVDNTETKADIIAEALILGTVIEAAIEARNESFPDTATLTLDRWEKVHGLSVRRDWDVARRRQRILAYLRATISGTTQNIMRVVRTYDPTATHLAYSVYDAVYSSWIDFPSGGDPDDHTTPPYPANLNGALVADTASYYGGIRNVFRLLIYVDADVLRDHGTEIEETLAAIMPAHVLYILAPNTSVGGFIVADPADDATGSLLDIDHFDY